MSHYIEKVTVSLENLISELARNPSLFLKNPDTDFSRNRKINFKTCVGITMNSGGCTLNKELLDFFDFDVNAPTVSAYTQQRAKILPEAFEYLFHAFTEENAQTKNLYEGYQLLACDGSNLTIAPNLNDPETLWKSNQLGATGNHLHLNALYDVLNRTYIDALVQTASTYQEHRACIQMIEAINYVENINNTFVEPLSISELFINNKIWETDAWKTSIEKVLYLTGSKRSENEEYINILNNIAIGKNLKQCVSYINTNVEIRNFAKLLYEQTGAVYLTAYRNEVDAINEYHVAQHKLTDSTYTELEYKENNFQNNTSANAKYPVKLNLPVYIGMPVMTILNSEGLYANGTRGIITKIKKNSITIKDINGKVINIHRKKIYALNNEEAYIYQFPIVPAYAMTIHKAQGLTLNRIILNPKTFVTGQAYVALSRVRCLKNIILTRKLREDDILVDYSTVQYILQTKAGYSITL